MTDTDLPANPKINPVVVLREEFDDWAVLFNPDSAAAVGINPVGVEIWKQLDGGTSMKAIAEHLQATFDEVPQEVEAHVTEFVEDLYRKGFIGERADVGQG